MKRPLLIATTNPGKLAEVKAFFSTLDFNIVGLTDVQQSFDTPPEIGATLEENAIQKALYYGTRTNMLTMTDDSGIFVDALNGWPGVISATTAASAKERCELLLQKMSAVPDSQRGAELQSRLCLFDPQEHTIYISSGTVRGVLTKAMAERPSGGFGYDPLFFIPEAGKTFAELTILEKNAISHRGKALKRMEYHLKNTYAAKNIVVPCALVIRDGKLLMQLRHDPHRPEYHQKWEFPGGGVEFGESMHENVVRETKEESGYDVEVVKLLQHIAVEAQVYPTFKYQVYLVPYVCKVVGGEGEYHDEEVSEVRWFDLDEVLTYPLVGENAKMIQALLPELRNVIAQYHL